MSWFWIIVELIATTFENYIVIRTMSKVLEDKYSKKNQLSCAFMFIAISTAYVTCLNQITIFEGWLSFATIGIFILYGILFLKGNIAKRILLPIILFSLILCINLFVTFIFSLITRLSSEQLMSSGESIRLITLFITKFMFYMSSKLIICIFKGEFLKLKKGEWFLNIFMLVMMHSIAIIIAEMHFGYGDGDILSMILVLCIIVISIAIFYLFKQISEKNEKELQISLLKMHINEQKKIIETSENIDREIRKAEHDLRHHFVYIFDSLEEERIDDAKQYIQKLIMQYEIHIHKYVDTENSTVNSVINNKIGYCKAHNIDTKVSISADFQCIDDVDICVVLSNLLDNAIEASRTVGSPKIEINISNKKSYLCIMIRNRIEGSVLAENSSLKTTKRDKSMHGLGLYSVSEIVNRYDGIKNIYEKNGFFTVDVWLKGKQYSLENRIKELDQVQTRQK